MVWSIYCLHHLIRIKTISFPSLGDNRFPSLFEAYRFIHIFMSVIDICFKHSLWYIIWYMYFQCIKKYTFFSLTDLTTSTTAPLSQAFCYFFLSLWKKQTYAHKHSFCTEAQTFLRCKRITIVTVLC
jgi:hypothetical protein